MILFLIICCDAASPTEHSLKTDIDFLKRKKKKKCETGFWKDLSFLTKTSLDEEYLLSSVQFVYWTNIKIFIRLDNFDWLIFND